MDNAQKISEILTSIDKAGIELPARLAKKIDKLQSLADSIEEANAEMAEETDATIKSDLAVKIGEANNELEEMEEDALELLQNFADKNKDAIAASANAGNNGASGAQTQTAQGSQSTDPNVKQKGNGWKWVLGGVVLVMSLGAVNMWNKQ